MSQNPEHDLAARLDAELDMRLPQDQDEALRRSLTRHPDPRVREIGRQLDAGTLTMTELATSEAYRSTLNDGIRQVRKTAGKMLPALVEHVRRSDARG